MENGIIVLILLGVVASIIRYFVRIKKRGATCVGCPYAKGCAGTCGDGQNRNSSTNQDMSRKKAVQK